MELRLAKLKEMYERTTLNLERLRGTEIEKEKLRLKPIDII